MSSRSFLTPVAPRTRCGFTLIELLTTTAVIALVVGLLAPALQQAREASRGVNCSNNLHQIGLALHAYHDSHGTLPFAYVYGSSNAGMYVQQAWTKQILPHLEQTQLYEAWDVSLGFAQGKNRDIVSVGLSVYKCPSSPAPLTEEFELVGSPSADLSDPRGPIFTAGVAEYFAVSRWTGPSPVDLGSHRGMLPFQEPGRQSPCRFGDVVDGLSNTIAVGECAGGGTVYRAGGSSAGIPQAAIYGHWAARNRLDLIRYDETGRRRGGGFCMMNCSNFNGANFYGFHDGGVRVLFGDGSCRLLAEDIDYPTLAGLCVVDDRRVTSAF